jgi:branched-chain amino acid transport system permease protein
VEGLIPGPATIFLFCGVSFVLVATPGPGVLYVVGRSMDQGRRAGVASMLGIELAEVVHVFAVALGIALALAGAAGSLLMPFYPAYPLVGQVFVLMAFVAVVLGTLGNVIGALIASLLMGVAESLGIQFIGADSGLIVVFALLLITLAVRPSGLAGGRRR